ncbi:hypothetical protein LY78DRAFT_272765 [Colletotrichum sublineola]|nr:hypothetical protein LY78DRAFT_272765 [Colletotrichum sublineola]
MLDSIGNQLAFFFRRTGSSMPDRPSVDRKEYDKKTVEEYAQQRGGQRCDSRCPIVPSPPRPARQFAHSHGISFALCHGLPHRACRHKTNMPFTAMTPRRIKELGIGLWLNNTNSLKTDVRRQRKRGRQADRQGRCQHSIQHNFKQFERRNENRLVRGVGILGASADTERDSPEGRGPTSTGGFFSYSFFLFFFSFFFIFSHPLLS